MTKIAAPPFEPDIKVEVRNLYREGAHGTMRETCRWSGVDETTFSKQLSPRQPDYHPVAFLWLTELYADHRTDKKFPGSNIVQRKLALVNRVVKGWEAEEGEQNGHREIADLRLAAHDKLMDLAKTLWPGASCDVRAEEIRGVIDALRDLESAELAQAMPQIKEGGG